MRDKIGLTNQTRGLLSEYGVIGAAGHKASSALIREVSAPEYEGLSPLLKDQLNSQADKYCYQNLWIQEYNRILSEMAHEHTLCLILLSIPGIGPINATAIYSGVTKRGNRYLRKQLVHGAHAVLFRGKGKRTSKISGLM